MAAPYMVLATQNPVEQEGTYRLPEAQLDRVLFKIEINYPNLEEETEILLRHANRKGDELSQIEPVLNAEDIKAYRQTIHQILVDEKLLSYIAQIVNHTRNDQSIYLGASPRASLALLNGARAFAATVAWSS